MHLALTVLVSCLLGLPSVAIQSRDDVRHHVLSTSGDRQYDKDVAQQLIDPQFPESRGQLDSLAELHATLKLMQTAWFELSLGAWPSAIDWTGAVLNTHVVAALRTLSQDLNHTTAYELDNLISGYFAQATAYYFGEHAAALKGQAYDDMLWVVLSWLETIKFVDVRSQYYQGQARAWYGQQYIEVFARRARSFYNISTHGWSDDLCNGGMTWNPRLAPYKNAITNQLFVAASVGMYLHFPHSLSSLATTNHHRQQFLDAAIDGFNWLMHSNMTDHNGLFTDGFHISGWHSNGTGNTACDDRNDMVYTYNQGVLLSGLRGLWQATGEITYLQEAHRQVQNTIRATGWGIKRAHSAWRGLGRDGIIEDYCDAAGTCNQDAHAFKGIFFHHLALLCEPLPAPANDDDDRTAAWHVRLCKRYSPWVLHNAKAALDTRDERGHIGAWWGHSTIPNAAKLPESAIDYRNNRNALRHTIWTGDRDKQAIIDIRSPANLAKSKLRSKGYRDDPVYEQDWNDRGRGRTVESHSGGVAVLRCLVEMQRLA